MAETLGQKLKAAREAKGITDSEAAAITKILRRTINALENDDFSHMPAPTYAKGFIRIYADYLGLEPAPLVKEYTEAHAGRPKPLIDEESQLEQNLRPPTPITDLIKKIDFSALSRLSRKAAAGGRAVLAKRKKEKKTRPRSVPSSPPPPRKPALKNPLRGALKNLHPSPLKDIRILAAAIAGLIVLFILISILSTCTKRGEEKKTDAPEVSRLESQRSLIDTPAPDLYLVEPGQIEPRTTK